MQNDAFVNENSFSLAFHMNIWEKNKCFYYLWWKTPHFWEKGFFFFFVKKIEGIFIREGAFNKDNTIFSLYSPCLSSLP